MEGAQHDIQEKIRSYDPYKARSLADLQGPYVLITEMYVPADRVGMMGIPPTRTIGSVYQFKNADELKEAIKVLGGVPAKTLEARVTHTVETNE